MPGERTAADRIARKVRVIGAVQGVFFRAWTSEKARSLGVTGWVRNCADGSVEAHLEGDERSVQRMIDRMRSGPPRARVDDLQVSEAAAEGLSRFEVRC